MERAIESGYYRVRLDSVDNGDWFVFYVPLLEDGRYDPDAPKPHLFKCLWQGYEYVGEIDTKAAAGEQVYRLCWTGHDDDDYLTDFLTVPIKIGSRCYIYEGDTTEAGCYTFVVRDLRKL